MHSLLLLSPVVFVSSRTPPPPHTARLAFRERLLEAVAERVRLAVALRLRLRVAVGLRVAVALAEGAA